MIRLTLNTQLSVDVFVLGLGLASVLKKRRKMLREGREEREGVSEGESLILHFVHAVSGRQLTFSVDTLG